VVAATVRGDDRPAAEALLAPVEGEAAKASLTAASIKEARAALERATRMREANDEPRARLAEALGRRWAEVARDLVRAANAENAAAKARLAADDAGARADRERSLLEEAIARQGRLQAELDALQAKQKMDRTANVGPPSDDGGRAASQPSVGRTAGGSAPPALVPPGGADGGAMP
jgi:hypothetical protein